MSRKPIEFSFEVESVDDELLEQLTGTLIAMGVENVSTHSSSTTGRTKYTVTALWPVYLKVWFIFKTTAVFEVLDKIKKKVKNE